MNVDLLNALNDLISAKRDNNPIYVNKEAWKQLLATRSIRMESFGVPINNNEILELQLMNLRFRLNDNLKTDSTIKSINIANEYFEKYQMVRAINKIFRKDK